MPSPVSGLPDFQVLAGKDSCQTSDTHDYTDMSEIMQAPDPFCSFSERPASFPQNMVPGAKTERKFLQKKPGPAQGFFLLLSSVLAHAKIFFFLA